MKFIAPGKKKFRARRIKVQNAQGPYNQPIGKGIVWAAPEQRGKRCGRNPNWKPEDTDKTVRLTLKKTARILYIGSWADYHHALNKYRLEGKTPMIGRDYGFLDFVKISRDYDGIYVPKSELFYYAEPFFYWKESSLVLWNTKCIAWQEVTSDSQTLPDKTKCLAM